MLRAVSNGVLRDLNTAIVTGEMMRGTRSIYVDYVDYDEVAHHAGFSRLESLASLTALDGVLGLLERMAADAPRRYRFVVLSDHGQSQGDPFAVRHGIDLGGLCAELMSEKVDSLERNVESWGRAESLFDDLGGQDSRSERAAQSIANRMRDHVDADAGGAAVRTPAGEPEAVADIVALGSGNLGLVYVKGHRRLTLEEMDRRWPRLVPGLAAHAGIGFAAVHAAGGPIAFGGAGLHRLATGEVEGVDPLEVFGPHAASMLASAMRMPQAPDVYVNSTVDTTTLEVAAFEDLVGCHGGLGGWQDRGTLIAPTDLIPPDIHIFGADQLHRTLVWMLEQLGHRTGLRPADRAL
jgi:hypothetical protein